MRRSWGSMPAACNSSRRRLSGRPKTRRRRRVNSVKLPRPTCCARRSANSTSSGASDAVRVEAVRLNFPSPRSHPFATVYNNGGTPHRIRRPSATLFVSMTQNTIGPPTPLTIQVRPRWGDCDPAGIAFYPRFFEWMDVASHALAREMGISREQMLAPELWGLPLVSAGLDFLVPARMEDTLEVRLWVTGRRATRSGARRIS